MKLFVVAVFFLAWNRETFCKSLKERSVDGTTVGVHRCDYEGRSYEVGAPLPTRHLCLNCICSEEFEEPNDRHCEIIKCPQTDHLERGCLPTYNNTDCCPIAWNCDGESHLQKKCDQRYFKHYLAQGCEPVYEEEGSECPTYFRCPPPTPDDIPRVCKYQGRAFEIGKRLRTSNPCERCFCRQGWDNSGAAEIVCVGVECFSDHRVFNDSCYKVYEKDQCCSSGTQCVPDSVELKSGAIAEQPLTCAYGGKSYYSGQRIYPEDDPCLVCTCGEGWSGDVQTDPNCRRHDCTLERRLRQLREGCLPIYHEATCCPIEFYCGENFGNTTTPLATAEDIDSGKACSFKGGHYRIGQILDIAHPTNCVTCQCSTPPDFTCVHRSCPRRTDSNCVSSYKPGSCCPTYECPSTDPMRASAALGGPSVHCSPVICPSGCTEVTVHNSCPFCKCANKLCSPPKCGPECTLDAKEGDCPSCKCPTDRMAKEMPPFPVCSPVKCSDHCHQVTPHTGCPMCVCGPLCSPPKCSPDCQIDRNVSAGQCPACVCSSEGHVTLSMQCSPVQCPPGCTEEVGEEGCPSCTCSVHCSPPKCDPGCQTETSVALGKCPGCVCGDQKPAHQCSPVKCGPLCHEAFDGASDCPTCICDPACTPPVCTEGCRLEYDPASGPCPHCVCDQEQQGRCPRLTCGPGCHPRPGSDGCPTCECGPDCSAPKCDGFGCHLAFDQTAGPCAACVCTVDPKTSERQSHHQCSTPKCDNGCVVDYSTRPCPSCDCSGSTGIGIPQIQCSPPKCDAGCRIDYTTKPCPACTCVRRSQSVSGIMCSPPKCDSNCKIDYNAKPCPTCVCGVAPSGVSGIMCSPPKCESNCRIDYNAKPCPSCICDIALSGLSDIMCSPPKCEGNCKIDYNAKPCPSCVCDESRTDLSGIMCSPPKCDTGCRINYNAKPCPSCICAGGSSDRNGIKCASPKCEGNCRLDNSAKPCPTCVCDGNPIALSGIMCSPPKCEGNCRVNYDSKPCPSCVCDRAPTALSGIMCSPPKCEGNCRVNYDSKPCPSCVCDRAPTALSGIMCSPPKCEGVCRVNYDAKPCPRCVCDGIPTGSSSIECSPPRCEGSCRVDYNAQPCPSCVCDGGPTGISGIICSPPKCEGNCHVDYNAKPCPGCVCDSGPIGLSGILCTPPRCEGNCRIDYNAKPCPSCVCDGKSTGVPDILCSPPKCDAGCRIDYDTRPCPSCSCTASVHTETLQCSPPKCDSPCRIDYSTKPCPSCSCHEEGFNPLLQCSTPKCEPGCIIDYEATPCPSCKCSEDGHALQCSPVHCADGCQQAIGSDGCFFCRCGADSGPLCTVPVCNPECRVDYNTDTCPTCVCDRFQRQVFSTFNVFSDPFCSHLKCGPGCVRAQTTSGPNERCPGCVCQGRSGEGVTCIAMQCELPCRFKRFSPHGCPSCVCHALSGMIPSGK